MTDRRSAAISRLGDRLSSRTGQAATLSRDGWAPLDVVGTFTDSSSDGELGTYGTAAGLDLSLVDFVVPAADLGAFFPPKPNDELSATFAGVCHRFAVTREGGEDVYRYSDPLRTLVRIHLRHLGAA